MMSVDTPLLTAYADLESRALAAIRNELSEPEFNALALGIHAFQRHWNAPYAAWCAKRPVPADWRQIPAVPQAMFKRYRLSCFPAGLVSNTFRTSGTTGETRGEHHLRDSRLYDAAAVMGWKRLNLSNHVAIFLTPSPLDVPDSSLLHMFGTFGRTFFRSRAFGEGTFLCQPDGRLDEKRLKPLFDELPMQRAPLAIFGTALGFLNFFEWMGENRLSLAKGSYALETGGFKGSGRDIAKKDLYAMFEAKLGIPPGQVWNEYGMCELSSQFYTQGLGQPHTAGPWVRALVVSPHTDAEVGIGETGVLRIFDLANVGSVLAIQTADLAMRRETGFELIGRDPVALPRGCSRAADEAMQAAKPTSARKDLSLPATPVVPVPRAAHALGNTLERAERIAAAARNFPYLGGVTIARLMELVACELGHAEALDRFVPYGERVTRAIAPRCILHVLSSNTPAAALQTLMRGLLLGAHNLCKLPSSGLPDVEKFVAALPKEWRPAVELSTELPEAWLVEANALVVYGNDTTIAHFHERVRPGQIFIPHGHKISFGLILADPDFSSVPGAARDVSIFDQQGCLSPHAFFVREDGAFTAVAYAERLAAAMGDFAAHTPPEPLTLSEANAIRSLREEAAFRAANGEPLRLFASEDTAWTVIADETPGFPSTPLNRVIFVKPLRPELVRMLAPQRSHLSAIGIWPSNMENAELAASLGALRVCPIGKMQDPPVTWHHDGMPVLGALVRWTDWER
jgi:hypothetical protein